MTKRKKRLLKFKTGFQFVGLGFVLFLIAHFLLLTEIMVRTGRKPGVLADTSHLPKDLLVFARMAQGLGIFAILAGLGIAIYSIYFGLRHRNGDE